MGNSSSSGRGHHEDTVDFGHLYPSSDYGIETSAVREIHSLSGDDGRAFENGLFLLKEIESVDNCRLDPRLQNSEMVEN